MNKIYTYDGASAPFYSQSIYSDKEITIQEMTVSRGGSRVKGLEDNLLGMVWNSQYLGNMPCTHGDEHIS